MAKPTKVADARNFYQAMQCLYQAGFEIRIDWLHPTTDLMPAEVTAYYKRTFMVRGHGYSLEGAFQDLITTLQASEDEELKAAYIRFINGPYLPIKTDFLS